MKTTTMNMFMVIAMTITTGVIERVSSAEPPAGTDNPDVQTRAIDKKVSDFPDHLSTPEAACAAWQRASARKDAQAISQLSWIPLDPAQQEKWYRKEEARDAEGLAIYLKALAESKIVEVLIWRSELAQVITYLPFPAGKGRSPFSARTFGCIKGQWKNLGEDRLPTLEAARENFTRKKDAMWQRLETIRKNLHATAAPMPALPPHAD